MRRTLKFIHTVATAALVGALLLQLLISLRYVGGLAVDDPTAVGARLVMLDVLVWVMVPSMVVVVVTGLALMGLHRAYTHAGWVWAKALMGLLLVKGVITVQEPAVRDLAALAAQGIANNAVALAELARLDRMEWLGGWLALVLCIAATAFGVWRPSFTARPAAARTPQAPAGTVEDSPAN